MNIRQRLIELAAQSKTMLGERVEDIIRMILSRQNPDGGFVGKGKQSDIYYTGFAILSLRALRAVFDTSRVVSFLNDVDDGIDTDLAHLAALIRCRRLVMAEPFIPQMQTAFYRRVESFHCPDGAYHHLQAAENGSAYGCFLAVGAYQDLNMLMPEDAQKRVLDCLGRLKSSGGGYYNELDIPAASVPATAAAMIVHRVMTGTVPNSCAAEWLMRCFDEGGFRVMPIAPVSDLLSTAVAVFALLAAEADMTAIRQSCLCFVDLLWKGEIGFCANPFDTFSDTEYMFYGLLTLGTLCAHNTA